MLYSEQIKMLACLLTRFYFAPSKTSGDVLLVVVCVSVSLFITLFVCLDKKITNKKQSHMLS